MQMQNFIKLNQMILKDYEGGQNSDMSQRS